MKQCRRCGSYDIESGGVIFSFDGPEGSDLELKDVTHVVIGADHWPACDGTRCNEMMCPMEVQDLCGPVVDLGHGGNLAKRDEVVAF